ncbi:MAG: glycosyltransferase family 2 protein [Candidatus Levybacteria bacterium]|nr:glycosyltransferase family 2 protein [Candidatus Levybacteria bacterium]
MKKKVVKIGAVIVHYGDRSNTNECINSLLKNKDSNIDLKLYLVDNDSLNRFATEKNKNIKYFASNRNLGFSGGVNIGIKEALKDKCSYILLINNDAVIKKHFFKHLLPYFKIKNVGMVSPVITYYDNPEVIWCANGYLNKRFVYSTFPYMGKRLAEANLPDPIEADFGAASLLVDSEVFRKIGFFKEKYFLYVEDVEFCLRAKKAGYRIVYSSKPLVLHKVSASAGIKGGNMLNSRAAFFYARNFFILIRDNRQSFNIITAFIGQTFIRLPFYIFLRCASLAAVFSYLRGYYFGLIYFLTGKLMSY